MAIQVSGSDGVESPVLDALRALGARVHVGHDAAQLGDWPDTVVVSTAVREDNPEYVEAVARGLRVLPALGRARVGDGRPPGGRGGGHPRQDHDDRAADRRPAGGRAPTRRTPSVATSPRPGSTRPRGAATCSWPRPTRATAPSWSTGPTPRSSPTSRPTTSTTGRPRPPTPPPSTSSRPTSTRTASWSAASTTPGAAALAERQRAAGRRVVTVSTRPGVGDVGPEALAGVTLWSPGTTTWPTRCWPSPPAARWATPPTSLVRGIAAFTGTRRRMEPKGEAGGVRVYDSYAHHPTEIAGDLAAARVARGRGPASSSPSSRTWSRAPGSSAPRWARPWAPPTRSWSATSTWPARTATPR